MSSTSSAVSADLASDSKEPECTPSHSAKLTPSAEPSCESTGPTCQSLRTCASLDTEKQVTACFLAEKTSSQPVFQQESISFAGDSPASHTASLESNWLEKMTAISGRNVVGLSKNSGRIGSLEKMLLESLIWRSTTCLPIWKPSATPAGRLIFQLVPLARDTSAGASGLLPTPRASDYKDSGPVGSKSHRHMLKKDYLCAVVKSPDMPLGMLNPQWLEWFMGYPIGHTELKHSAIPSSRKSRKSLAEQS